MVSLKPRFGVVVLVLSLLAVIAMACAPAAPAVPAAPAQPGAPTQAPAQPAATKFGGTFKVGSLTDPDTLNVLVSNSISSSWVLNSIYPTLLFYNVKGEKVGYLATEWKTSQDGKTVTFKLRNDLKWDDGKPVTSADVKYTAEVTMKETIGNNAALLAPVTAIDTPDPQTIVFTLKNQAPFLPPPLAIGSKSFPRTSGRPLARTRPIPTTSRWAPVHSN